eukprot:TRINITY_DN10005_c0_g1_i1.p1 TRINITY_DN10005_c0_g1~~TRINITY_DN10005_c0_g1_i1.p1  ORF type:complete len:571 (-),score=94.66 TRINITY_DN10005_c0_g1_i1:389-2101(-)
MLRSLVGSEMCIRDRCARMRRSCPLPVIFTVRTQSQGGAFPDNQLEYFQMTELAIRLGFQWVDLESHWEPTKLAEFLVNTGYTKVIGSHHFKNSNGGTAEQLAAQFRHCAHGGLVDMVKVVIMAQTLDDTLKLVSVSRVLELPERQRKTGADGQMGVIALAMGAAGVTSRILNEHFTPVSHPILGVTAAPGQIPLAEIHTARRIINVHQVPTRRFYVFGVPGSEGICAPGCFFSAGFEFCHLLHSAEECNTDSIQELTHVLEDEGFGGAAVGAPLHTQLWDMLESCSEPARAIGALNTLLKVLITNTVSLSTHCPTSPRPKAPLVVPHPLVVPLPSSGRSRSPSPSHSPSTLTLLKRQDGGLHGDNTEWVAILKSVQAGLEQRRLAGLQQLGTRPRALVVGTGSIARAAVYALLKLGFEPGDVTIVAPAAPSQDDTLLGGTVWAETVEQLLEQDLSVVLCCLESGDVSTEQWPVRSRPVVADLSRQPERTCHLIKCAQSSGCILVPRSQVAMAAGWEQFRRWLGYRFESMALAAFPTMEAAGSVSTNRSSPAGFGDFSPIKEDSPRALCI